MSEKRTCLTLRLPWGEAQALAALAASHTRSINEELRHLVKVAVAKERGTEQ